MGQQQPQRCRWINPSPEGLLLDSLSVLPSSIQLMGSDSLSTLHYDLSTGVLQFEGENWPDSVQVCYRTLPYSLHHTYQHRSLELYDSTALYDFPLEEKSPRYLKEELFATDSLEKSGSLSRGISFGNRQSVFVQSVLNLQLEGKLTDNINIRAAISDQNVPYQPEGNTQRLQEFDKVFIELYNEDASLIAGDIVLQQEEGYFLKYLKNVQGVQMATTMPLLGLGSSRTSAGVALAKGRFASVQLEPVEGLSGPYQLPGPLGQRFVMVLSNSEKVYLDGRLLKRGFNYDYTIDYNLGEITFNPGIIITPYSRIRVDYEYSDRQYSRSTLNASHSQQLGRLKMYTQFYQEKDSRNQPLMGELSEEEKLQLSLATPEEAGVYIPAIDSIGYSEDLLLYRKVDTVSAGGNPLRYYEFSTDPQEAVYQLSFAEVGNGNGNYVLDEYIGTGKVYRYVPPVNGLPQGNFEPIRFLSAPTKKNMLTGGLSLPLDEYQEVFTELAFSGNDQNLFAEDEDRRAGIGLKAGYRLEDRPASFDKDYRWSALVDYELTNKDFSPIDRFRSIEFDREWGVTPTEESLLQPNLGSLFSDHILSLGGALEKDVFNGLRYRISGRQKGSLVNGWQQEANARKRFGKLQLEGQHFYLNNQQAEKEVKWMRWEAEAALHFSRWVPGYRYIVDRQASRQQETDSLLSTLMNFREHQVFVRNGESSLNQFALLYSHREDQLPLEGEFKKATLAHTVSATYATKVFRGQQFRALSSYRYSKNYIDSLRGAGAENILSGQFNWLGNFWKNILRTELVYTLGNGRELRRDFVYVKVPTGEGTHTWRDENNNGIQELGEFYEAINPDEKEYLRIFVPNNDFILAHSSELNYRLNYTGIPAWAEERGIRKVLGNFSGNISWRSSKKSTEESLWSRFIPVAGEVAESPQLLSTRQLLQLNLFYNRSNLRWGMDGSLLLQERKQLLSAGFEAEEREQYRLAYRYNFSRSWGFRLRLEEERLGNYSDFLKSQQFYILSHEAGPELSWMPGLDFQAKLEASVAQKENRLHPELAREALLLDASLNLRYSRLGNTLLQGEIRQVQIDFEGEPNSPAGYAMLEALQPGNNWLWEMSLQQKLINGLQLNLSYEGRQSEGQEVVHLGRMMLQALF
ncbi:hypothetical protein [Nafulsella turpanensis]|uniref:hypothetical protein n=1 Tax=Nafulsella turpanensis TaxID=1265690 RepID=UPI00135F179C|nr:hypothetical protein [Nafulsella turpanensis]